jgi:hypothetical protein
LSCGGRSGGKGIPQQDIDEIDPTRANFPATAARLMIQAQAVLFNLQKPFVDRENFSRALRAGHRELILSMRQDLFEMAGHLQDRA